MEKEKNIQTIQHLYANVGRKSLPGVLESLTDDILWEPPFTDEIPHTKLRIGKHKVTNFVIEMAAEVTYTEFVPQDFLADGDTVIVKGFFKGHANHSGKTLNPNGFISGNFAVKKYVVTRLFGIQISL